jgi:O-antigen/teichoic acid export membrane protein
MAALATPIVLTLYGDEWRPAIGPFVFVAVWTALASLASLPGAVFKAIGRSWLLTATGIVQLALLVPAVWIATHYGITAVAAAQVVEKLVSLGILGAVVGRVLDVPWHTTYRAALPAAACAAAMAVAVFAVTRLLPGPAGLVAGVALGAWCYAVLLRTFMPDVYRAASAPLSALVGRRRAGTVPAPEAR